MTEPRSDALERPGDEAIVAHLRYARRAIADTVDPRGLGADQAPLVPDPDPPTVRRRWRGRVAAGAAVAAVALSSVAWNRFDQREVERIPVEGHHPRRHA